MSTSHSLGGRIALVTGGASGLGRGAAEAAAAAGAHVVIADLDEAGGPTVAGAIGGSFIKLDVADEAGWLEIEAVVKRKHGGLDVAVLAAGIGGPMATVSQMELPAWRKLMAVNLDGTMLGIRTALHLMEGRGGSIITVASVNGVRCTPTMSAYAASKAGVRVVTRVAALEGAAMKPVVRVNCILPGPMDTPLLDWLRQHAPLGPERTQELLIESVPLKRLGLPADFAALACFLASDASSFITGAEVPLDGGLLAG
jgi:NAD(P)-dependent dehydrogenase (short-subunit alcohol dehydrogenase family)